MSEPTNNNTNNNSVGPASPTTGGGLPSVELARLMQENHALLKENNHMLRQMRAWSIARVVMAIVFVVVPLIGALIYLPRFMQQYLDQINGLL